MGADKEGKQNFITDIYRKYVKLVELLKSGERSAEHNPSVDEFCMTTAYAVSRMSSCLKRKVGAVVTIKKEAEKTTVNHNATGLIYSLPCIISTGYNEVPLGSYKCIYHPKFQMCYRDHLQEVHARKFKYCPECGTQINQITVKCSKCNQ